MECTNKVRWKCDELISLIKKQRDSLLNTITELKTERKSELEALLQRLQSVNDSAIIAQKECKQIAVKADLATSSRLEQMETVLKRQEEAESKMYNDDDDDEEKETQSKTSDIKLIVIYDEEEFVSNLDMIFNVEFNGEELELKYEGMSTDSARIEELEFSTEYKSSSNLALSDFNCCVRKTDSKGHRYILVDDEPVTDGIHCWRIKVKSSADFSDLQLFFCFIFTFGSGQVRSDRFRFRQMDNDRPESSQTIPRGHK